jgi:hypothetical protein
MAEVDGEDDLGEAKQSPAHTRDGDDEYFEVEAIKSCKLSSRVRHFSAYFIFILIISLPQAPQENLLVQGTDFQRHLRVSREQEVVSNLSFLSATTDDSLGVMAVCLEECRGGRSHDPNRIEHR